MDIQVWLQILGIIFLAYIIYKIFRKPKKPSLSESVKFGNAFEKFAPITKEFFKKVGQVEDTIYVGKPIDFICFKEDEIVVVEVKTGKSKLTKRESNIKRLIEKGKMRFVELNYII